MPAMKSLLTLLCCANALLAAAQTTTSTSNNFNVTVSTTKTENGKTTHHQQALTGDDLSLVKLASLSGGLLDTVRFECPKCNGNMKLLVNGNGTNMTYEQKSSHKTNTLFPVAMPLPPGNYVYTYWQNGVEQMKLPFTVKAGEKNVVTVK
ncbi:hypothetical protein [Fibrella aquatilis]|uniref:Uncharacterized protein n=1 Tax=Fibrella aquatilis TaxID=2817059 RepID=A0A939G1T6_9BACT|nr:hypothetical protein [Fibrella aquatilis]MBO0930837.1 hypothetical protein [Fibrella aquatilis]